MSAKQQQDPPPIGSLVTVKYLGLSETVCIIVYDMYAVLCICENYVVAMCVCANVKCIQNMPILLM